MRVARSMIEGRYLQRWLGILRVRPRLILVSRDAPWSAGSALHGASRLTEEGGNGLRRRRSQQASFVAQSGKKCVHGESSSGFARPSMPSSEPIIRDRRGIHPPNGHCPSIYINAKLAGSLKKILQFFQKGERPALAGWWSFHRPANAGRSPFPSSPRSCVGTHVRTLRVPVRDGPAATRSVAPLRSHAGAWERERVPRQESVAGWWAHISRLLTPA